MIEDHGVDCTGDLVMENVVTAYDIMFHQVRGDIDEFACSKIMLWNLVINSKSL